MLFCVWLQVGGSRGLGCLLTSGRGVVMLDMEEDEDNDGDEDGDESE